METIEKHADQMDIAEILANIQNPKVLEFVELVLWDESVTFRKKTKLNASEICRKMKLKAVEYQELLAEVREVFRDFDVNFDASIPVEAPEPEMVVVEDEKPIDVKVKSKAGRPYKNNKVVTVEVTMLADCVLDGQEYAKGDRYKLTGRRRDVERMLEKLPCER